MYKLILAVSLLINGNIASAQLTVVGNSEPEKPTAPAYKPSCGEAAARLAMTKVAADNYIFNNIGGMAGSVNVSKNNNGSFGDGYLQKAQKNGGVFYYNCQQGKAFAVWGDIMNKWGTKKWETGELGWPTSNHSATPSKPGAFTHFQGGSIYWSNATGSHIVKGAIKDKWSKLGWENSELGFPKTDEMEVLTKVGFLPKSLGVVQDYEGGRMYYKWNAPAAFEVRGLILGRYTTLQGVKSFLGWPTSDELAIFKSKEGRQNSFEKGVILWSPATGAHAVPMAILKTYEANGGAIGKLGFPTGEAGVVDDKFMQEFQNGIIMGTSVMMKENNNPQYKMITEKIKVMKPIKIDDN